MNQRCSGPIIDPRCGVEECPWGKELGMVWAACEGCLGSGLEPDVLGDIFTELPCDWCGGEGARRMDACEACGRRDIE